MSVGQTTLATRRSLLHSGVHELRWRPDPSLPPRTYILRLTARPVGLGARDVQLKGVARLLGVDAGFAERSAAPGGAVTLVLSTDAKRLELQMLRSGGEGEPTYANGEIKGVPAGAVVPLDWRVARDHPAPVRVQIGADFQPGVYAARIQADDGRVGFAPIVVRPAAPQHRVAVVMPTTTWQAYNSTTPTATVGANVVRALEDEHAST